MYYPNIDYAVTVFMRKNGVTQRQLAEQMLMCDNSFSWKRRGLRDWSLPEAVKLSNILGLSLDVLTSQQSQEAVIDSAR